MTSATSTPSSSIDDHIVVLEPHLSCHNTMFKLLNEKLKPNDIAIKAQAGYSSISPKKGINRQWWRVLFSIRGIVSWHVLLRVMFFTLISVLLATLKNYGYNIPVWKATGHNLLGVPLGLLLVYRTNSSYDRYWEGRKLWANVTVSSINLMRCVRAFEKKPIKSGLGELLVAFIYALKAKLRGEEVNQAEHLLSTEETDFIHGSRNSSGSILILISDWINENCPVSNSNPGKIGRLDTFITDLSSSDSGLLRIITCPIPFSYIAHIHQVLLLYLITLPFCVLDDMYWFSIAITFLISFALLGIEEAGKEIEDPFGTDRNDLPLDKICLDTTREILYYEENCSLIPRSPPVESPTPVQVEKSTKL
ncbi:hypothetical protein AKO1_012577 [Acrasis kona]|uniref:Bestrophin homolog n=1 Tax=Acrasis kona TaxID=1008807 RepID=A0AAW2YWS6_9EUKA